MRYVGNSGNGIVPARPSWCEEEQCLASLFHFPHLPASQLQSKPCCSKFVEIIRCFRVAEESAKHGYNIKGWHQVCTTLQDPDIVTWYPEYGCALLALGSSGGDDDIHPQLDEAILLLVCLDDWKYHMHTRPEGLCEHTSLCVGHTVMACGSIPAASVSSLRSRISSLEQIMHKRRQQEKKGLQRTPAFIRTLVMCAAEMVVAGVPTSEDEEHLSCRLPHGGFTDVGQHSGGQPRDTCWPLVRETTKALLARMTQASDQAAAAARPPVCQEVFLHLDLWLLRRQVALLKPAHASPNVITAIMLMLQSATAKAAQLADAGFDTGVYEKQCADAAKAIKQAAGDRMQDTADIFQLPSGSTYKPQFRQPCGKLPPSLDAAQDAEGLEAARQRAAANLHSLPVGHTAATPFSRLLAVVRKLKSTGAALQHKLHIIERVMFEVVVGADSNKQYQHTAMYLHCASEGAALQQVVDTYRAAVRVLLDASTTEQACVLQSRELLVVWVAYCLYDAAACQQHEELMDKYGVSVDWQDLQHLVLGSKLADDAALGVAAYLRNRSKARSLFSLRTVKDSMDFAREFVRSTYGRGIMRLWNVECQHAEQLVDAHWTEVQRKQQKARQLRSELSRLRSELSRLDREYDRAKDDYDSRYYSDSARRHFENCKRRYNSKQREVSSKESELERAEAAPPAIIQPLPRQEHNALPWLFFMYMPELLRQLSHASFLAQQMLLPRPCNNQNILKAIEVPDDAYSLTTHFNTYPGRNQYLSGPSRTQDGADSRLALVAYDASVPELNKIGPKHVDHFYSRDYGIWWPDELQPSMQWSGTGEGSDKGWHLPIHFNPSGVRAGVATAEYFTEKLHGPLHPFVLCSEVIPDQPVRGNQAIACQGSKPSWLSKPGWLDLGRLRSYPMQQLHRLCVALKERTLPLSQPTVQQLVQQAMYQLGPLLSEPPYLHWRTGWTGPTGVLATLTTELQSLAGELQEKPREQQAVLLLGPLAAYVSEYRPSCRDAARKFAGMTAGHADVLEQELSKLLHAEDSTSHDSSGDKQRKVAELVAKQVQWRTMALGCHIGGVLSIDDVADMVQLMVLIQHGSIYQEDEEAQDKQAQCLVRAHRVMAAQATKVLAAVQEAPNAMLTLAVKRVLQRAPDVLQWVQLQGSMGSEASWEAIDRSSGALYSINVLDGTVLYNGLPPDRLPSGITEHPLFVRVFGKTNFEVQHGTQPGVLQTVRPVRDRFYDFYLAPAATGSTPQLTIREVDTKYNVELQQIHASSKTACSELSEEKSTEDETTSSESAEESSEHEAAEESSEHESAEESSEHESAEESSEHESAEESSEHEAAEESSEHGSAEETSEHESAEESSEHEAAEESSEHEAAEESSEHEAAEVNVCALYDLKLELLDINSGQGSTPAWVMELPTRLQDTSLYSHWLCREHNIILLRPPHFQQHDTLFVIQATDNKYDVRRVPQHLRDHHWTQLLQQMATADEAGPSQPSANQSQPRTQLSDALVLTRDCQAVRVLNKFEDAQYIHVHATSNSTLLYELPRYGLEFELVDGQLQSRDFAGYNLRPNQQLVSTTEDSTTLYTLPEFKRYLILQRSPSCGFVPNAKRVDVMVLVPRGAVERSHNGSVDVQLPSTPSAKLQVHCYEQHNRFKDLRATSILARLQLAALYAATSSLLPEPSSQHTGAQMAMQLVRQCWVNSPLQDAELQQLQSVGRLGGYLAAGLPLLVHELQASSYQLMHLYPHLSPAVTQPPTPPRLPPDLGSAWQAECVRLQRCGCESAARLRSELTLGEEMRVMGTHSAAMPVPEWKRRKLFEPIEVPALDVDESVVQSLEQLLCHLVRRTVEKKQESPLYPLDSSADDQERPPLVDEMHVELQESWQQHHKTLAKGKPCVKANTADVLLKIQVEVRKHRAAVEDYLHQHSQTVPSSTDRRNKQYQACHGAGFRLHQLSGTAPLPSQLCMVRWAEQPQLIERFNPFLSAESCQALHAAVLLWLQLIVLEDRVQRALTMLQAGPEYEPLLVQELETYRCWDVQAHPTWLTFEAEGQLQIRPVQYTVAKHLMDNPGAIVQLNMGEGKTRVILPMLALHWAYGKQVVRLNLLFKLMDEAHNHLHNHLCASVLSRKLFTLPFHRDVHIDEAGARAIRAALSYCQQERGLLLVAPEHRLSLQLKWHELRAKGGDESHRVMAALDKVSAVPYIDILDESDELLHHRFQLIYAMGSTEPLPSRDQRVSVLQALLRVVSKHVQPHALPEGVAVWEPTGKPGCFCGLRLLKGDPLNQSWSQLREQLANELIKNPPYELRWIARKTNMQELIKQCAVDDTRSIEDILGPNPGESGLVTLDEYHQVLALRGFLACGLLLHCLQLRTQVDFGINRSSTALKRLAVPYRAAHTPSERSEFAQPDVAIALTHISYYRDGLTRDQLVDAMAVLLKTGTTEQEEVYKEWLDLSRADMTPDHLELLDDVRKIDPSSAVQLDLLHHYYSHNQAVVDFWLAQCVLPMETQQFPQRLCSSSWDVAHNEYGKVVGFSGTNDNHRLLPLQVRKSDTSDESLLGTNGKMLHILLHDSNRQYHSLAPDDDKPLWQQVLDLALAQGLHALIDCGALLAGTTNSDAAKYMLQQLECAGRFQGVTYYDTACKRWMVLDFVGRCMPLTSSPIRPADTFTIYDDARCRGADLQLRQNAVGLLTLGPSITKDKLMQAAGRLRQIGRGQTVQFVGTADVTDKIRSHTSLQQRDLLTSQEVLSWVMHNTVQATMHGLCAWSHQGLQYAAAKGAPERAIDDEVLELEPLYSGSSAQQPVEHVVDAQLKRQQRRCTDIGGAGLNDQEEALMERITKQAVQYGAGFSVVVSSTADEECERELERQEEEEEEAERQVPHVTPAKEQDWDYARALLATSIDDIHGLSAIRLKHAAGLLLPSSIASMSWSPKVFCTPNHLIATSEGNTLNDYLRPVDSLLLMPSGQLLLLSEREADRIQQLMWQQQQQAQGHSTNGPVLLHLAYVRDAVDASSGTLVPLASRSAQQQQIVTAGVIQQMLSAPQAAAVPLSPAAQSTIVCTQLFNGDCTFAEGVHAALKQLVHKRKEEALALVASRGKLPAWARSQLEITAVD